MDVGGSALNEVALGKRLQLARQAAGLTQQMLCQKAGLSYSTLTKIERGAIKSPSIFTIQSIAAALGLSLDDLIGNTSEKKPRGQKQRERSKSGACFVYFDVNGCLVRSFHRSLTQLAHDSGQPADIVESAFWHNNDLVCRGEMTLEEFNSELAKRLHVSTLDWFKYYLSAIEPIPEMHEVVNWAAEHYGIGLLTNIMPGLVEALRVQGFLPDVAYDAIVDSSEVHAIKPEVRIYEIAQERAAQAPSEILLIDDTRANLMAAEKLGWRTLWFDNYRSEESAERIRQVLEPAQEAKFIGAPAEPDAVAAVAPSRAVESAVSPSVW